MIFAYIEREDNCQDLLCTCINYSAAGLCHNGCHPTRRSQTKTATKSPFLLSAYPRNKFYFLVKIAIYVFETIRVFLNTKTYLRFEIVSDSGFVQYWHTIHEDRVSLSWSWEALIKLTNKLTAPLTHLIPINFSFECKSISMPIVFPS